MPLSFRAIRSISIALLLGVAGVTFQGCGEPEPPPMTPDQFDTAKKNAEVIIQKEHGQAAFDKGQAAEKARSK